jgi:drug/metabolite transporter (DMT)-like permease
MKEDKRDLLIELKPINVISLTPPEHTQNYYYVCMFFGYSICAISIFQLKLTTKICGKADSNQTQFYRCLVMALFSAIALRFQGIKMPSYSNVGKTFWLNIRNITGYLSSILMILCLGYLRISTTQVFSALSPVLTCVLSVFILKERFHPRYILGILVCFSGCLVLIMNDKSSSSSAPARLPLDNTTFIDQDLLNKEIEIEEKKLLEKEASEQLINTLIGVCFGVLHTISLSFHHISSKILLNDKIENNILIFYYAAFNCVGCVTIWQFIGTYREMWFDSCFVYSGLFNGVLFYTFVYLLNVGMRHLDLLQTAGFGYLQIVESFFLGAMFLGENVYFTDILGSLIIVAYNLLNSYFPIKFEK